MVGGFISNIDQSRSRQGQALEFGLLNFVNFNWLRVANWTTHYHSDSWNLSLIIDNVLLEHGGLHLVLSLDIHLDFFLFLSFFIEASFMF